MSKKIMFLDTETTGLPITLGFDRYYSYKELDKYTNSRIVEVAYVITDDTCNFIKEFQTLIKPQDYTINNSNIHGITNEQALNEGIPIQEFIKFFKNDLLDIDLIVAHNLNFDIQILLTELFRQQEGDVINKIIKTNKKCTMKLGKRLNIVPEKGWKYPKLQELYDKFFPSEERVQNHRALDDTMMCMKCYFKMK